MEKSMEKRTHPKILIIGGGIAGISAAKHLIEGGLNDVTILEAKERLGGRIHTIDNGGKHLEMGAQWIHGEEDNPLYDMAASNSMLAGENHLVDSTSLNSFEEFWETQFFTQDGHRVDSEIVRETCEVLDEIFDEANKFHRENKPLSDKDESMGTFLFDAFYKYLRTTKCEPEIFRIKEAIFNWHLQMEKTENGCKSLYELSARAWGEFRECKGQEEVTLCVGYHSLLDLLLCDIPAASLRTLTPVQCVYWDQQHCRPQLSDAAAGAAPFDVIPSEREFGDYPLAVRTKHGALLPADHVIVTASLGVLKKHAHFLFKPILPRDKMSAIHRLGFGTVDKVYVEWEEPWWHRDMHAIQLAWMAEEQFVLDGEENMARSGVNDEWYRGLQGFELVDYQPNLLCGWIAGAEAEAMETVPDSTVLNVCHQLLRKFTGNTNIPKPTRLIRSTWAHDAYTAGSYSYIRIGSSGHDMEVLTQPLPSPQCPHLLFAGEATHPEYFSTVHGALISGQREAKRLLQYYTNSTQAD